VRGSFLYNFTRHVFDDNFQVIHNKRADEVKTFFETAGNHIVKYFCKSEEDLTSYIKEQKRLVADKRNDDKRNKLRCTRNTKHTEELIKTNATSMKNLQSVPSTRSTSNLNEVNLNVAIPIEKKNMARTAVEKVNLLDFNSFKFNESNVLSG